MRFEPVRRTPATVRRLPAPRFSSQTPLLGLVEADQAHRDHAIEEQVIAKLKSGPLAGRPSGKYAANAAWVAHAAIAFNLARALDATTPGHRRWATLRTRIINVPARS